MEKRENMEPKYMTKTSFDLNDYRKYVRTMQGSQLKNNIVALAVFAWLVAAGIYNIYHGKTALGVFMLVVGVAAPLLASMRTGWRHRMTPFMACTNTARSTM